MPDDPYVPVGGWEAAGYSGFSPYANLTNYGTQAQNTTPAPVMSAPQQFINYSSGIQAGPAAQTTNYQPQQLIASNAQQGYGMTGPLMTNQFSTSRGGAGGGTPGIAQQGTVQNTNSAGGYSGLGQSAPAASPYGRVPTLDQFMNDAGIFQRQDDNGNNYWSRNGRSADQDMIQQLQQSYNSQYSGGANLNASNPYAIDTSYQSPATPYRMPDAPTGANTYGSLSYDPATRGATLGGYQPQPVYASPAGGSGLQSGADTNPTLGSVPNTAATSGATLGGNNPFDLNNYQAAYTAPSIVPMPPPRPANLDSQWQTDAYGFPRDDQTYMDIPQGANGQYGSLMGGQEYGQENPWAQSVGSNGSPNPGTVQINTPPSPTPVSTQPQAPNTSAGAQMPGTSSPYGAAPISATSPPPPGLFAAGGGSPMSPQALSFTDYMQNQGYAQRDDDLGQAYWSRAGRVVNSDQMDDLRNTYSASPGLGAISRALGTPNIFGGR